MCAKPTATESESDFHQNGDPVELDLLLHSNMPHADGAVADEEDECIRTPALTSNEDFPELDELGEDPDAGDEAQHQPAKRGRPKAGAAQPVRQLSESDGPQTVYQRLVDHGLLRKLTDIVMAKVSIPWHLRQDATQEVHTAWSTLKANPKYQRNQLARYAYMSGQHAALKLRRTIGAVVVIPGALFRGAGRETAFMEAIGAAVNPKDVDDYKDSLELSTEPMDNLQLSRVSNSFFEERLGGLGLSPKQLLVARKALVERVAADDIAIELGMDLMYVERLLNQVTNKLVARDEGNSLEKPARKPGRRAANEAKVPKAERVKAAAADAVEKPGRRARLKKLKVAA